MSSDSTVEGTAPQATVTANPVRNIADLTYRNYDGPLRPIAARWWTVAVMTIRSNVNKRKFGYWIPASIILIYYLVRGIEFYVSTNAYQALQNLGTPLPPGPANPYTAELYGATGAVIFSVPFFNLPMMVATLLIGSSSIAADLKANALLVYLSKPLTRFDYLFGKWLGIFILLTLLTLVPSLLMFLFFVGAYASDGFLKSNPTLIFRVLVASMIPALLHSSLIVGFSAWSRSTRMAGAVYAGFYLVLGMLTTFFGNALWINDKQGTHLERTSIVLHASIDGVRNGLSQYVYNEQPAKVMGQGQNGGRRRRRRRRGPEPPAVLDPTRPPLWAELLIGGVLVIVPLAAATAKVRAVEVVKG